MLGQAAGRADGQVDAVLMRERAHGRRVEAVQGEVGRPRVPAQPQESRCDRRVVERASAQHRADRVDRQAAEGEQERLLRRSVDPVQVVDPEQDRPVHVEVGDCSDQCGPGRERSRGQVTPGRTRSRLVEQLADHAEAQCGLGLLAGGGQDGDVPGLGHQRPDQRGLPDAGLAVHERERCTTSRGALDQPRQDRELLLSTNQRRAVHAPSS